MSKILFYTDFHLTAKTPRHRIDSFADSLLKKLKEIYEIAEAEAVDCVCFGGDFYNNHRIFNYDMINGAMEIICDCQIQTHAVIGQHDLIGYNKETYRTSTLSFMERHCAMFETLWRPFELSDCVLYPCHWFDKLTDVMQQQTSKKKKSILVAHQTISREKLMFQTHVTSDLSGNYDLVLSGDWHGGFETHTANDILWCNPGSIGRLAISDCHRNPQVALVNITKGKPIEIELRCLKSAGKAEEVFGMSFLETIREKAGMDTSNFVNGILELEQEVVDVFELIDKIGKSKGIRQEVLSYIASKKTA
jgi:DNA repair protein SbcD/Mre11